MPVAGGKSSDETRRKLSEARRLWWANATPEQRATYKERQAGPRPKTSAALKGRPKPPRPTTSQEVPCNQCGKPVVKPQYLLKKFPHQFCSQACSGAFNSVNKRSRWPMVTCLNCGAEFRRQPSREKHNNGHHYCSRPCAEAARTGENSPRWTGGRTHRPDGYIDLAGSLAPEAFRSMIRKDGRIMEHRLVMAQQLGRPLEDWEVVHHKSGVRSENQPDNLEMHSALAHNGITAASNRRRPDHQAEVAALRRQLADATERLARLEAMMNTTGST